MHAYEPGELLPAELIKQIVSYARQHCHPQLTREAKLVIKDFYLQLREKAAMQKSVCITVCTLAHPPPPLLCCVHHLFTPVRG
jgi:DNA replicative helicase MCM subunit Mcm2 (Cdc46/Mcm family)